MTMAPAIGEPKPELEQRSALSPTPLKEQEPVMEQKPTMERKLVIKPKLVMEVTCDHDIDRKDS
jgi:hypothetical protein